MNTDLRDRVTRVEEKVDRHDEIMDRVTDTLDRLVRFQVRHEKSKSEIADNETRLDALSEEISALRSYVESRWYVGVTVAVVVVSMIQLALQYL